MSSLRLALFQTSLSWESPRENRAHFNQLISSLNEPVDIIILPEMFTTGFTMNTADCAESPYEDTHRWMVEMAARKNAAVVGSYIVQEGDMNFNRLIWAHPDGSYEVYNKKHLFRMAEENEHFTAGNSRILVEFRGWKVLPLICYDLRFPAWSRNHFREDLGELDYDLLIYVANWPSPRTQAWDGLLKARAIENHAYCAGLNRIGSDGNEKSYDGHSAVYDPKGNTLAFSESDEILIIELQKEPLEDYRRKFPAYLDSFD